MNQSLNIKWTSLLINGLISLLIGVYFVFFSESLSVIITYLLGGGLTIAGLILLFLYYTGKSKNKQGQALNLVQGIVYVAIGVVIIVKHDLMLDIILYIIGLWLILSGISSLFYGFRLRKHMGTTVLMIAGGVLGLLGLSVFVFLDSVKNQTVSVGLGALIMLLSMMVLYYAMPVYRFNLRVKKEQETLKADKDVPFKIVENQEEEKINDEPKAE